MKEGNNMCNEISEISFRRPSLYLTHAIPQKDIRVTKDVFKAEIYTNSQTAFQSLIQPIQDVLTYWQQASGLSESDRKDIVGELEIMIQGFIEYVNDKDFDYCLCQELIDNLNDHVYFYQILYVEVQETKAI